MAPRLTHPPNSELISFEAFSAAMTAAPLEDLHKTYDSDGENDLEDNYEGEDLTYAGPDIHEDAQVDKLMSHSSLENDNDNVSDDDSDDYDHDDTSNPYEYFDPRFDIDRTKLTPGHAKSKHINPELQTMIDRTEIFLEQLSLKFQPLINEQPMSTSIILANQATDQVLRPYGRHGSQARLSESAMKFLSGGDTVRRPGREGLDGSKDGKLRFVDPWVVKDGDVKREKLKRKAEEKSAGVGGEGCGRLKIKIRKRADGTSVIESVDTSKSSSSGTKQETKAGNVSGGRLNQGQPVGTVQLDGPMAQVDSLSFRKTSGPMDIVINEQPQPEFDNPKSNPTNIYTQNPASLVLIPSLHHRIKPPPLQTLLTPLATSFSNIQMRSPTATTSSPSSYPSTLTSSQQSTLTSSQQSTLTTANHNYTCTHNPTLNAALPLEAYNPISMKFSWPAHVQLGTDGQRKPCMPTPGALDSFNTILHLYNAEARNLLSYYVRKYDTPAELGGSPGGGMSTNINGHGSDMGNGMGNLNVNVNVEPPHALFRLGISQYLQSKIGNLVDNKEVDSLGLNPEARRLLGQVWERHPSTHAWFDDGLLRSDMQVQVAKVQSGGGNSNGNGTTALTATETPLSAPFTHLDDDDASDLPFPSPIPVNSSPDESEASLNARMNKPGRHAYRGGLNPVEKTLLARACNVSVETVEAYWEGMRDRTRGWAGMKMWCAGVSAGRISRAKRERGW